MHLPRMVSLLVATACAVPLEQSSQALVSLNNAFQDAGKLYFGAGTDRTWLEDGKTPVILEQAFGSVTPMNNGKWRYTQPSQGSFVFDDLDYVVNWAMTHGMLVRGHSPIWEQDVASWVAQITDIVTMGNVLVNHVTRHVGRYRGMVYAWDVVNEVISYSGLINNACNKVLGEDYIRIAFEAARRADPQAKLYINDNNIIETGLTDKTKTLISKVKQWVSEGIPIDGIGAESHASNSYLAAGQESRAADAFRALCSAVRECAITELDVAGGASDTRLWTNLTRACLDVSNCVGVTVWGIADHQSWQKAREPLLFDAGFAPKRAYSDVLEMTQQWIETHQGRADIGA